MGAEQELIAELKAVLINNTLAQNTVFYHDGPKDKNIHTLAVKD